MPDILILGGTAWFGRTLAERAVAAGHAVTCLARGSGGASVPAGARLVRADRTRPGAYREVAGRDWDLVVEISWQPGMVGDAVSLLGRRTAGWVLISSCSVYARHDEPGADESADLLEPVHGDAVPAEDYGGAKVACEQITAQATGDRAVLMRAGLIGGDGDASGRTGYWPGRCALADGGPVLVPDAATASVQIIDVRDLADFTLRAGLGGFAGPVNAVGERSDLALVLALSSATAVSFGYRSAEFVSAQNDWLLDQGVSPWAGPRSLPLWLPGSEHAGFAARSDRRALDWGLVRRPMAETLASALEFELRGGLTQDRRSGLTRAEELALLVRR